MYKSNNFCHFLLTRNLTEELNLRTSELEVSMLDLSELRIEASNREETQMLNADISFASNHDDSLGEEVWLNDTNAIDVSLMRFELLKQGTINNFLFV